MGLTPSSSFPRSAWERGKVPRARVPSRVPTTAVKSAKDAKRIWLALLEAGFPWEADFSLWRLAQSWLQILPQCRQSVVHVRPYRGLRATDGFGNLGV